MEFTDFRFGLNLTLCETGTVSASSTLPRALNRHNIRKPRDHATLIVLFSQSQFMFLMILTQKQVFLTRSIKYNVKELPPDNLATFNAYHSH